MNSYIRNIRAKIGNDKLIHPAARILVENKQKEVLVIMRRDHGQMGIPAGALEENETIAECIIREVKEETGLRLTHVKVIGISSHPALESVSYPNGDQIQYCTIEFYSNQWEGEIQVEDTEEVSVAKFVDWSELKQLPEDEYAAVKSYEYFRRTGSIRLN